MLYTTDNKDIDVVYLYILYNPTQDSKPAHYDSIINIRNFLQTTQFCDFCQTKWAFGVNHHCPRSCISCSRPTCQPKVEDDDKTLINATKLKCDCNAICNSESCFELHLKYNCKVANKCENCPNKKVAYKTHVCTDQKYCRNCKKAVADEHQCFILTESQRNMLNTRAKSGRKSKSINQSINEEPSSQKNKCEGYIFYDYEAFVNKEGYHEANLVIASAKCINCIDKTGVCEKNCQVYTFQSNEDFCKWLFTHEHQGYTALAHNFKGKIYLLFY